MSEIKTSAKGIDYAKPYVLKTKSGVYSQAMLMSIPHKHSKKIDVSLKIGRYTLPFGNVETQKPKSELTLDNDELNSLISYITDIIHQLTLAQANISAFRKMTKSL